MAGVGEEGIRRGGTKCGRPTRPASKILDLGGGIKAARMTAEPGWRWSECIKPVVGTDSCQAHHVGTVVGGSMHVADEDGTEQDIAEGDAYVIEPGHDAWVTSTRAVRRSSSSTADGRRRSAKR